MGRLSLLILVLFVAAIGMMAAANHGTTTIHVPMGKTYEVPKVALIIFSFIAGFIMMLAIVAVRDTHRFFITWQFERRKKREARIEALYIKASNALLGDNEADARAALDGVLKENPQHTGALIRSGNLASRQGRNDDAIRYYRKALETSPDNLEALFSLEEVFRKTGRTPDAMEVIEKILVVDPTNHSALYRKRSALERQGRWDDVIEVQKTIIKNERDERANKREQQNMIGYRYELAREALEGGEIEKAGKGFRAILKEDPTFVPAALGVTEVLLSEDSGEDAVSFLETTYKQTGSVILLARLEDLLIGIGEPSRLIRVYRAAVQERPKSDHLKFFLGKLYFRLEMIDDAFDVMNSIENPEAVPDVYILRAELYLRREQCNRAVAELKKSLDFKKAMRVPYCCGICGHSEPEWAGRCPECGSWNTFRFDLDGACKIS